MNNCILKAACWLENQQAAVRLLTNAKQMRTPHIPFRMENVSDGKLQFAGGVGGNSSKVL